MRTGTLGFALCAGLALSACATTHPAKLSKAQLTAASACADWRWIGITDAATDQCPTPGWGWTAKPLFKPTVNAGDKQPTKGYGYERRPPSYGGGAPLPQPTPQPEIDTAEVVAELNRFCVYETTSSKRPWHPPFLRPEAAGLVRLDRDCAGISRAAVDLTEADAERLSQYFLAQAGGAEEMEINNRLGVRLAFLDTQPTGVGVPLAPGHSKHGYTLAHIANRLVCSPQHPERCAAQITTRLAMPMLSFDRARRRPGDSDHDEGGGFGTQSDLADAIYAEVNDWQAENGRRQEPQHLVLNLSLGWDPELLGGLSEESIADMQAGSQAVYQALQYAKSLDVLVLAAAGNRRNCCPQSTGPLLPAAWEESYPGGDGLRETPRSPLLYAVGGVQSDGRPLANAREGGMPQRVAHGQTGVVASRSADGVTSSTGAYTGSSVATAVVAAAAALVWDTVPTLSPAGVMQALDESGASARFPADFWFDGGRTRRPRKAADGLNAPDARQISVCTGLLHACKRYLSPTSLAASPAKCPVQRCPEIDRERAVYAAWAAQPVSTACHPWLVPQPEDPLCPACSAGP